MEKTLLEEFERNPKILLNENLMIKQLNKINDNSIEATNELISDLNIPKLNQNTLKFIFYELIGNIYDHYKFSEAHIAGRQNKNKYDFIFMDNGISIINSFIVIERKCADGTHKSRLSNGPVESLNRIVKDMKRNGRGFRNFEHLRNRFLFANRANAQMLSVPLPPERYQVHTGLKRGPYKKKNL